MLGFFQNYIRLSGKVLTIIVVASMAALVCINAVSIGSRSFGFPGIHWSQEVSVLLAMTIYYGAYGVVVRQGGDIRITTFTKPLPRVIREALAFVAELVQAGVYVTIGILGIMYLTRIAGLRMPLTRLSEAWLFVPLVVGLIDAASVIAVRLFSGRVDVDSDPAPAVGSL